MNTIIVSDLHIGSKYFFYQAFEHFLERVPKDCELVLNGDIIDNPYVKLQPADQRILDRIEKISYRQRVVWVRGNHDNGYIPKKFGKIQIKPTHAVRHRLFIAHGHYFDKIMPRSRVFMKAFKLMHDLRLKLGARPVHVAEYAKKWELLYKVLRKNVMLNAVNCARENGFEAVTCGHTHYAEDIMINGIRYINTGAWTELPAFYLLATDSELILKSFHPERSNFAHGQESGQILQTQ